MNLAIPKGSNNSQYVLKRTKFQDVKYLPNLVIGCEQNPIIPIKFVERKSNRVRGYQLKILNADSPFLLNRSIMPTSIITTDDLREFKMELLDDIKTLLTKQASGKIKKYLKSSEVMALLQVSPGTLQNLRINGTLPYTKVGGIIYYDTEEIQKVMDANRVHHSING